MNKEKLIIFDADGVLYDAETLSHKASYEVLRKFNPDVVLPSEEVFSDILVGIRVKHQREVLEKYLNKNRIRVKFPENFEQLRDRAQERMFVDLKPIPGIVDLLQELKDKGIPFCIGTRSRKRPMDLKVEATGLNDYFSKDKMFYPEMIEETNSWDKVEDFAKQNLISPAELKTDKVGVFLFAAMRLNVLPENCLVIEDTQGGLMSAVKGNMKAVPFVFTEDAKQKFLDEDMVNGLMQEKKSMRPIVRSSKDLRESIFEFLSE